MRILSNVVSLGLMVALSALEAAGQIAVLPNPVGSTVDTTGMTVATTYGMTVHVCSPTTTGAIVTTCPYTTAKDAVHPFIGTGVDLTLIDEVRGDNITQGMDIFSQGLTLHFVGTGSGTLTGGTVTAYPYIIDTPIHVGPQESIEGVGTCPSGSAIGCTRFILSNTFPAGTPKPASAPVLSQVAPGTPGCPSTNSMSAGTWSVGVSFVTASGSTESSPLGTIALTTDYCIEVPRPPTGTGSGVSWAVFAAVPGTGEPLLWQATSSYMTPGYIIRSNNLRTSMVNPSNPPPNLNLSQVGITLGASNNQSTSAVPVSNDLAGNISTGNLARNFTLDGNGAQTRIAITTAQNQGILSNVDTGNCGSVTPSVNSFNCLMPGSGSGTTPTYCTAAIVYEGFNGRTGPVAFPTRDITVFPSTCSTSMNGCTLFNNGGGTTSPILPNYCILVDGASNPAPFTNVALPCAQPPPMMTLPLPLPFAAFELLPPTGKTPKVDIHGLHVEASGQNATFVALQNKGYALHVSGIDCSQTGTCMEQDSGVLSSQLIVAGPNSVALVDKANPANVYMAGVASLDYSVNAAGNFLSTDFPVTYFNFGGTAAVGSIMNPGATALSCWGFPLPYSVKTGHIAVLVSAGDSGGSSSVGLYTAAGAVEAYTSAVAFSGSASNPLPLNASVVLPPGNYLFCYTSSDGSMTLSESSSQLQATGALNAMESTTGGQVPEANLTSPPPFPAVPALEQAPIFMLYP